jgi:hypothetical protein
MTLRSYNHTIICVLMCCAGSKDNISAVVVQLPGAKIAAPDISGSTPSATSVSLRPVDDEEASIDLESPPDTDL